MDYLFGLNPFNKNTACNHIDFYENPSDYYNCVNGIIKRDKFYIAFDFGDTGDLAVFTIFTVSPDRKITFISSAILGRTDELDQAKRESIINNFFKETYG